MRHRTYFVNWKSVLGTAVLATGFLLFAGAPGAKAEDCQDRIAKVLNASMQVNEP